VVGAMALKAEAAAVRLAAKPSVNDFITQIYDM
jgi:hypothetical protein